MAGPVALLDRRPHPAEAVRARRAYVAELRDRAQLVVFAYESGLVSPGHAG